VIRILAGAILGSFAGALIGNPWLTGAGFVVAAGALIVAAGPSRLLRGGLLVLALAAVIELWGWVIFDPAGFDPATFDPAAFSGSDLMPGFLRAVAVAVCLAIACALFAADVLHLPRDVMLRIGRASPTVAAMTLVLLAFSTLVPSGLSLLFGSRMNVAMACLVAVGGYAWFLTRAVRSHGRAALTAAGLTALVALTWVAWSSLPSPTPPGPNVLVAVSIDTGADMGPDIGSALAVTILLTGAALITLTCAHLRRQP
jgi:hypothetical protein